MFSQLLPTEQMYDGSQLRSHFILNSTGHMGDAIVAFCGAAKVDATHMVDQEDIATASWIYSPRMLHFLVEHFHTPLQEGILRQRLLVAIIHDGLRAHGVNTLQRSGDDLYDGEYKLSVSIAAESPISTCIHTAINIETDGTPVPTRGLCDYKIIPEVLALHVMRRYVRECDSIVSATQKVLPIR